MESSQDPLWWTGSKQIAPDSSLLLLTQRTHLHIQKQKLAMGRGLRLSGQLCEPHKSWDDMEDAKCLSLSRLL